MMLSWCCHSADLWIPYIQTSPYELNSNGYVLVIPKTNFGSKPICFDQWVLAAPLCTTLYAPVMSRTWTARTRRSLLPSAATATCSHPTVSHWRRWPTAMWSAKTNATKHCPSEPLGSADYLRVSEKVVLSEPLTRPNPSSAGYAADWPPGLQKPG
jgi:hypothetical protein